MDQDTQSGVTNQSTTAPAEHSKTKPMVLILTGVLILIIAILYIFASKTSAPSLPSESIANEPQEVQKVTNTSDDVSSIEADLNTSINGLDDQNF